MKATHLRRIEPVVFFVSALLVFAYHTFCTEQPHITLIFDSQAYLYLIDAVKNSASIENLQNALDYVLSGFSESKRLALRGGLTELGELTKAGPVLPAMISPVYALFGKPALPPNWVIGAWVMMIVQSLSIPFLWLAGRLLGGISAARIVSVLAITYPAFIINSPRILTEIPASLFMSVLIYLSIRIAIRLDSESPPPSARTSFLEGLAFGVISVALALSKSPLFIVPLLTLLILAIFAGTRPKAILPGSGIAGLATGCVITVIPWLFITLVITGQPTPLVERYGAYNLWAGSNLTQDGWNSFPAPFDAHPENFKKTTGDVVRTIIRDFQKSPAKSTSLLLRKPLRLGSWPWNDFQNECFGLAPWLQAWWHQILFLLALAGGLFCFLSDKRSRILSSLILLVAFFHPLIYIPFVSISRYFFPAVPAMLLLAALTINRLLERTGYDERRKAISFAAATLFVTGMFAICSLHGTVRGELLSELAAAMGIKITATIVSALSIWFIALWALSAWQTAERSGSGSPVKFLAKWSWIGMSAILALFVTAGLNHTIRTLEWHKVLAGGSSVTNVRFPEVRHVDGSGKWYIIADLASLDYPRGKSFLKGLQITVNNLKIPEQFPEASFRPLFSVDSSLREYLTYLSAFAYCQDTTPDRYRQWWCIDLPVHLIKEGQNYVSVESNTSNRSSVIFGDFPGAERFARHALALFSFSWTKGWLADMPGEMRMDDWSWSSNRDPGEDRSSVFPRLYLVRLPDRESSESSRPSWKNKVTLDIPDATVCSSRDNYLATFEFTEKDWQDLVSLHADSYRIIVSGKCRSPVKSNIASISLTETISSGHTIKTEFAPLSPPYIRTTEKWYDFEFEDILPLSRAGEVSNGSLQYSLTGLRLICSAKPWWNVLAYADYKSKNPVEFKNLKITIYPHRSIKFNQPGRFVYPAANLITH